MTDRILAGLVVVPFLLGAAVAPADQSQVVFSFRDHDIIESSGLVVVDGLVVTTNDSGDTGRVFTVDPATGKTVGVTRWGNDPTDVEALAPLGDHQVWAGDIGDNTETRQSIQVSPVPVGPGNSDVDAPVYDLVYPDGPHNAETLMTDPTTGRLYVATKEVLGGTLYAAPERLDPRQPNLLEPLGDVLPIATDGAFLPDGKQFVVRNYAVAAVYDFPSLEKVDQFQLPSQQQGEGLAVDTDGSLLLSSEGVHSDVLRVDLPASEPSTSPSASPSPQTESHEDSELPETTRTERPAWPWFLGGLIGLGCLLVLARSLRRR
ncbi:MAG: hypothetical protein QOD98_3000 [Nocardioidaceae bacterium]|nr:hypothetical protein [Nocardioidaceae bacterium]